MFPLGSVLFPHMPLALRVFEQRYRVMLARVLADDDAEFGVVLIERGREAGGGEQRFAIGTIARIEELGALDEDIALVARGGRRVEVVQWLDDDPHPMAVVRDLPELDWDESLRPMRDQAELIVRRAVSRASEFVELPWSGDAELSDDPVESSWQLAGIAPVGALDQLALLRSTSLRQLLSRLVELTLESEETIAAAFVDPDLDAELAATIAESERSADDEVDVGADDRGTEDQGGADDADDADGRRPTTTGDADDDDRGAGPGRMP